MRRLHSRLRPSEMGLKAVEEEIGRLGLIGWFDCNDWIAHCGGEA
jgi:hypothetical protein